MEHDLELKQDAFAVTSTTSDCVTIRLAAATDFAQWDGLWIEYLAFYDTVLPQAQHERTFKRYTTRPEMKSFVAVDAHGRLIGLASIICHASGWTEQPVAYLQDLFVSPKERKRGVGKALLHHAAARVREAGGCKLHWLTKETNYRARAVYDTFADGNAPNGFIQYSKKLA